MAMLSTAVLIHDGAEPSGHPHQQVAEWTIVNRLAVMNVWPFMTVLHLQVHVDGSLADAGRDAKPC